MSPFRTLNSSGNSSKLALLRTRPKEVSLSASSRGFPSRPLRSVMVRNLYMRNGSLFKPGRHCRNRTGEPSRTRMRSPISRNTGDKTTNPAKVIRKSIHLLTKWRHLRVYRLLDVDTSIEPSRANIKQKHWPSSWAYDTEGFVTSPSGPDRIDIIEDKCRILSWIFGPDDESLFSAVNHRS
ncbi:MAG: hypothetical protein H6Q41_629 [Deltaproteobacteria bacterium]|nr:hypothetical protein [Deltaproteobacteria bacterium]